MTDTTHPAPADTPAPPPTPTGTEARVVADIAQRQQLGIAKYGTTVADNPLPARQWLQHAYEEGLDMAVYLRRLIDAVDAFRPAPARAELLEWHDAATTKPDSDITVLLWAADGFFCGWWDDEQQHWLDAASGGVVVGVQAWAEPEGPPQC